MEKGQKSLYRVSIVPSGHFAIDQGENSQLTFSGYASG